MKRLLIIILLVFAIVHVYGQSDTLHIDLLKFKNSPRINAPNTDLKEHWYWEYYLSAFGKNSILKDTTIKEAYRLIYCGNYLAIVELIKRDSVYILKADSWMDMTNQIAYRKQDTLTLGEELINLRQSCEKIQDHIKESTLTNTEIELDDRDSWVFEYKIDHCYRSMEGIEVQEDFKDIIIKLMKIGELSGFRIYDVDGSHLDIQYWPLQHLPASRD